MAGTIQPESLDNEIAKILEEYGDEVSNAMTEAIEETAKEAQQSLKSFNHGRNPWKKYPKGWRIMVKAERLYSWGAVYNSKEYRLTHLLEFGHATRNGGRTQEFPHIAEVNEFAQSEVLKRLREKLEK